MGKNGNHLPGSSGIERASLELLPIPGTQCSSQLCFPVLDTLSKHRETEGRPRDRYTLKGTIQRLLPLMIPHLLIIHSTMTYLMGQHRIILIYFTSWLQFPLPPLFPSPSSISPLPSHPLLLHFYTFTSLDCIIHW